MARFRSKSEEVGAEPCSPGRDEEFTETVLVLVTPAGRREFAVGDWTVTKATGEREVVNARVFQAIDERCSMVADRRSRGPIRKGIPMRSG